ncbi:Multiple coagulation factor deficiency protein 2-like protein [Frankliniella fusca]|uniref:Multiple coagulation factor deficiency protein 2-like protein n=1 Tax=Frankliniella fusca TaxID=407009 RepID=A0AAE1H4M4_9NEOP|nr:Multiple coagulation factor deficiency protein 2-like protein [Frankliniella fusca]
MEVLKSLQYFYDDAGAGGAGLAEARLKARALQRAEAEAARQAARRALLDRDSDFTTSSESDGEWLPECSSSSSSVPEVAEDHIAAAGQDAGEPPAEAAAADPKTEPLQRTSADASKKVDYNVEAERYRHLPGPPPSPLLVAVVTAFVALVLWPSSVLGMRGPHHPRGEVIKHQHYRPSPEQHTKLTQDAQLLQDKEHIREDLGRWATEEAVEKMTPEELQFHYFKLHDLDENVKLDGLEILRAIMHTEEHESHGHEGEDENSLADGEEDYKAPVSMEYYTELIDEVLREDDTNNDGYLSYPEYVVGRNQSKRRAAEMMAKPKPVKELPGIQSIQTK